MNGQNMAYPPQQFGTYDKKAGLNFFQSVKADKNLMTNEKKPLETIVETQPSYLDNFTRTNNIDQPFPMCQSRLNESNGPGPAAMQLNNFMLNKSEISGGKHSVNTQQQQRVSGVPSGPITPVHNKNGLTHKLNSMVSVTNTSHNDSVSVDTEGFDCNYGNKKNKRP